MADELHPDFREYAVTPDGSAVEVSLSHCHSDGTDLSHERRYDDKALYLPFGFYDFSAPTTFEDRHLPLSDGASQAWQQS